MLSADTASRCAVLGDPVEHSLSPVLHRAGYEALGLARSYEARRVSGGSLASFLDRLSGEPEWRGFSVTAPLKREALEYANRVSEAAALAGGANTLIRDDDGWRADNTDLPGAVAAIRERYHDAVRSGTVIGGGATAASTGLALAELGAREIRLVARDPGRAAPAAEAVRRHPSAPQVDVLRLDEFVARHSTPGEVVVSTIPAQAQTPELVAAVVEAPVLFEVTYDPWPTPAAAGAMEAGRIVVSGLDLLVHQAVLQFEAFTGQHPPLAVMRAAGEAALAERAERAARGPAGG